MASWNGCATRASASVANVSSGIPAMSYPAEKTFPSPVMRTQRISIPRSSRGSVSARALRMSWSSALRRSGLEIVRRATAGAGWSRTSLPPASSDLPSPSPADIRLLEDDEDVALLDRLALLAADLLDGAGILRLDRHLHLHRLQDRDGVALVDLLARLDFDLPDGARDVRGDLDRHGAAEYPPCPTRRQASEPRRRTSERAAQAAVGNGRG